MKHKLFKSWLMLVCLLFGVGTSWAESSVEVISTLNTSSAITINSEVTKAGVLSITGTKGSSNAPVFNYNATDGVDLRFYKGSTVTFAIADGYKIESIVFNNKLDGSGTYTSANNNTFNKNLSTNVGTFKDGTWTAPSEVNTTSVTYSCGSEANVTKLIYSITVTYSSVGNTPTPTSYNVIIANDIENGTVKASPTSATADTEVTLTATPADGYEFGSWKVTNASTNAAITVTNNKFKMPAANVNVSATFNEVQGGGDEPGGETTVTWVASEQGYANGTQYTSATVDDNISLAFGDGGNDGKYYDTGSGIRIYSNGKITVSAANGTISKIVITYSDSSYTGTFSANTGEYKLSKTTGTWTGSASSVVLTNTATSGHARIQKIAVTYASEGGTPDTPATDPEISNFIKTSAVELEIGAANYDVRECLNIPSDYDQSTYAITTTIDGLTQKDGEFACVYPYLAFQKAGTYTVTVKAAAMPGKYAETTGTITVTVKEPETPVVDKTIAEFIASEGGKCYLTGIVSDITNTKYGNFTLTDESGSISIYGCLTPEGESAKFSTLDVVAGDKIKVLADEYLVYNEIEEAKNVIFVEEFEIEKAQYTVTIEAPENGTLVVKNGETALTSGDKVEEGTTLTVECTPANEDYRYKNWQYKEDGNWITMTTTMTRVVTQNISIRANFEAIPVYAVNWSVNGEIVKTENVKEGAAVSAPEVGKINEKVFTGWVTSNTVDADKTPEYVKPATATADATYYAVFATKGSQDGEIGSYILDYAEESDLSSSTAWDYNTALEYTAADGSVWEVKAYKNKGMQLNKGKGAYIKVPECPSAITSIEISSASNQTVNFGTTDNDPETVIAYITQKNSTIDLTGNTETTGYIWSSTGSTAVTKIVVNYGGGTCYSNFTTLPIATTVISITTPEGYSTFMSKKAVVMPEGLTGSVAVANGEELSWDEMYKAGDVVPALTPILVKGPEGIANHDASVTYGGEKPETNYLYANTTDATKPASEIAEGAEKFYVLSYDKSDENIGFYWLMEGGASFNVPAGKVFLAIPGNVQAKAAFRLIEESTGINAVKNANAEKNAAYNLNGQRVNANAKGIVIVNGKKVLNK
ncbi:MAG: hypothetical protein MJZ29_11985 [Bacteroidaceae bacterium]|nr:hypothetical protein [Bacteroidaceae bacterium]